MATIFAHPDNIETLKQSLPVETTRDATWVATCDGRHRGQLLSKNLVKPLSWSPPGGGRFVSYGPEDEAWMRPLGLGTLEMVYYVVDEKRLSVA